MIRHCTDKDDLVGAWPGDIQHGEPTHCGMTFDDVERSTICPHPLLWPEFPSWVELLCWCVASASFVNDAYDNLLRISA